MDLSSYTRRALLQRIGTIALGGVAVGVLAACGPAAQAPAQTSTTAAPASTPAPVATTAAVAAPTTAASQAGPAATVAPATASGGSSQTLRYASADFSNETLDPIVLATQWGWALYDSLLTFDAQGNAIGNIAETYNLSRDGLTWTSMSARASSSTMAIR